jgi:hypothetical protein
LAGWFRWGVGAATAAYNRLASDPGDLVMLSELRSEFPNIDRGEFDKLLRDLDAKRVIHLEPEVKQSLLSNKDRAAALSIGGEDKHLIRFMRRS